MAAILWLRRDLRLADNPALRAAMAGGRAVIPVFVWAPEEEGEWAPGAASRWWLHQSLEELGVALGRRGSRLVVRRGPAAEALLRLARECGADGVFWNGRGEAAVTRALEGAGIAARELPGNLLFEPGTILNRGGQAFQVFTAFWKACLRAPVPEVPLAAPRHIPGPAVWPEPLQVRELKLEPEIGWAGGLRQSWQPGEAGGLRRMKAFLRDAVEAYAEDRNRPDRAGTSRLSPHLHFGEVSARQVWHAALARGPVAEPFLRQLAWREFAHHLLFHFPETPRKPLRAEFSRFPWVEDAAGLRAWQRGMTGYPLVDAGMRELWRTGWMHNRVRMVAASFLVGHLLIPWQEGAAWFRDTLVDADLANNTLGWQWCAGCGADAAPYFRIFNPALQGAKFDPEGSYVRRWIPELAGVPERWIHRPWLAPAGMLGTYPRPMVAHEAARRRALAALASLKK
ncbi:MAG TPA: deoxyribodipyrimidine photo-lyase [Bryobacteraceae bacterium]|nr:deoxyribodipyrimidine photo-lyase [Bryobacteraceae bacterium]